MHTAQRTVPALLWGDPPRGASRVGGPVVTKQKGAQPLNVKSEETKRPKTSPWAAFQVYPKRKKRVNGLHQLKVIGGAWETEPVICNGET